MLQLDISKIDPYKIDQYDRWPVSQKELHDVRDALLKYSVQYIRNSYKGQLKHTRILHISYIEIVRELLVMMRSNLVDKRTDHVEYVTKSYPYLNAIQNNSALDKVAIQKLSFMKNLPAQPSNLTKKLRPFKLLFGHKVYKRKPLSRIRDNDIVTIATSSFIERHARNLKIHTNQKIVLNPLWEWYDASSINITHFDIHNFDRINLIDNFLSGLLDILRTFNVDVTFEIAEALESFSYFIMQYTGVYRDYLLSDEHKSKLPNTLWFGSVNAAHARILRACVQENGGYTIGHDHGRGIAAGISHGELGTVFDFCDEFYTYSEFLANNERSIQQDLKIYMPTQKAVKFSFVPGVFLNTKDVRNYRSLIKSTSPKNKQKTVMLLVGVFMGEKIAGLNILPSDKTAFDFQIEFIKFFKKKGYNVILKNHPENKFEYPEQLKNMPGVEIIGGYVEDQIANVDLICLDFLSSAFKTIVMSDIPILFFDFGWADFSKKIRTELRTRIAILEGKYNEYNAPYVQWDCVADEIKCANDRASKNTDAFLERFYGMVDN